MTVRQAKGHTGPPAVDAVIIARQQEQWSEHRILATVAHSLIRGSEPHSDHTSEGFLYLRAEVRYWLLKTCSRVPSTVPIL